MTKNAVMVVLFACLGAAVVFAADTAEKRKPAPGTDTERVEWLWQCIEDFRTIRPGMTRREVEKRFPMDGGLQSLVTCRHLHPDCDYFKVDVTYVVGRDANNQGRVVSTPDDKVQAVSKPYIEEPAID